MALEPAKLSDFKLSGTLGSGATAKVYEAVHVATGRPVAIKLMMETTQGPEMRERFAREALLLSDVQSRHVSKIVGFGFDKGQPFLVLELLNGETLDAKLRRDGAIPTTTAARWIEQLIVGVRDCHDAKVIHRDIKPANIFLHQEPSGETVKLIDFGVARLREIAGAEAGGLTSPSHIIGSMGYMAPEQFRSAKSVGFSADLYAVGVVIYRTLTGRLPFVSRSLEAVIRMKSEQPVPAVSSMPGMVNNALLDWVVAKAMARDPDGRFQSAREMLDHWRNVVASIDERSELGRVDESYAGRRPEARTVQLRPEPAPIPLPSQLREVHEETIRQLSPFHPSHPEHAVVQELVSGDDAGPETVPFNSTSSPDDLTSIGVVFSDTDTEDDPHDPYDQPTRPNPDLRKIVERELELGKNPRRED